MEEHNIEKLPEGVEKRYVFTCYAKVREEIFFENGQPFLTVAEDTLYQDENAYYIESRILSDDTVPDTFYEIPDSVGGYLNGLAEANGDVQNKAEIFACWGIKDEINEPDQEPGSKMAEEEGKIQSPAGKEHEYTEQELTRVSSTQKVEVYFEKGAYVFMTESLQAIADFYNHLEMEQWQTIAGLPDGVGEICVIKRYQEQRKTWNKDLILVESLSLSEAAGVYYICSTIPAISEEDGPMTIYYQIPEKAGEYLLELESGAANAAPALSDNDPSQELRCE